MISRSSLCPTEVSPPQGQLSVCSTRNFCRKHRLWAGAKDATHSIGRRHPGNLLCGVQNHAQLWAEWQTSLMLRPFSLETFRALSCHWVAFLSALLHLAFVAVDESYMHHALLVFESPLLRESMCWTVVG